MQVGSKEVAINIIQHKTLDNLKINKAFTMAFVTKETIRKMNIVWFEDTSKDYIMMGETAGKAFSVGKTLMK